VLSLHTGQWQHQTDGLWSRCSWQSMSRLPVMLHRLEVLKQMCTETQRQCGSDAGDN
jgi:hypothetical protein